MASGPVLTDGLALAGDLPPAHRDDWLAAVATALDRTGALSPAAALDRLRSSTYDGITVEPLYTADDLATSAPLRPTFVAHPDGWDVRQRVDGTAGPGRALTELERGATSILLDLTRVDTIDADAVARILDGVLLDVAPIVLQAGDRWTDATEALVTLLDRAGIDAPAGSLGADPVGLAATAGVPSLDDQLDAVARWFTRLGADRPGLAVVTVDGTRFHEAGASDGQELGCTIAAVVEHLRALERRGVDPTDAVRRFELRLAATGDQFATVAKFRAVRLLWARIVDVVGAPAEPARVHAITSTSMLTTYDPWVNALRSTVACFAAGIGGTDAVTVLPHDHLRAADATELGRRLARNTQSILILEAHLAEVVDPAGGSWYVERFTDELAGAGWTWFQEIEAAGGLLAAADSGLVASRLTATTDARRRDVDTRRAPITGVSEFPNIDEPPPASADDDVAPHRWAADFEELRRRVDRVAADTGRRPGVFLAAIGPPATSGPRVTFARNLFEVAGLATIPGPVTDDPTTIADAFGSSGAAVACICSTDAVYEHLATPVAAALDGAGAAAVYLAGRPRAGIERAIHAGVDVRATLTELLDVLLVRQ